MMMAIMGGGDKGMDVGKCSDLDDVSGVKEST